MFQNGTKLLGKIMEDSSDSSDSRHDRAIQAYFKDTPRRAWSYLGFLKGVVKPIVYTLDDLLPWGKANSVWKKRFIIQINRILEDQRKTDLLRTINSDNEAVRNFWENMVQDAKDRQELDKQRTTSLGDQAYEEQLGDDVDDEDGGNDLLYSPEDSEHDIDEEFDLEFSNNEEPWFKAARTAIETVNDANLEKIGRDFPVEGTKGLLAFMASLTKNDASNSACSLSLDQLLDNVKEGGHTSETNVSVATDVDPKHPDVIYIFQCLAEV
ncbi:hypothetical protein BC938DRAFT_484032 [Jimgerdemannia flammicorona]|uniref:Uncharacterized protein n=1 Tax=Jimgerdemannia flammicorona TaxID=994334 RepID=A0A433QAQ9_9FUNG|nr:hypothetical protein BC938DRAFT_484032 [Jimgerdemannia flammicorona]